MENKNDINAVDDIDDVDDINNITNELNYIDQDIKDLQNNIKTAITKSTHIYIKNAIQTDIKNSIQADKNELNNINTFENAEYAERTKSGFLKDQINIPWYPKSNDRIYKEIMGIKIFDNTTPYSRDVYEKRNNYLSSLTKNSDLFTDLIASTLTAQGEMTGILFNEKDLFGKLPAPTGHITMIGCNYGEIFNPLYESKNKEKKQSIRGRKPKPKLKMKRKTQGTGKYFSSQITFPIEYLGTVYKIKLFRTGVFQVPGVRNPNMYDLVVPIHELKCYLENVFHTSIQITNFTAVMRNYKVRLTNYYYHVDLEKLENIIIAEKKSHKYDEFLDYMLDGVDSELIADIKHYIGNYNPLQIAEMTYNTDRCFCLIIKFYRPSFGSPGKKTTVKLLKKGKINFDGGNSEQEIKELYYWLRYLYVKHASEILTDIRTINNEYDVGDINAECSASSIYDDFGRYHIEHQVAQEFDCIFKEQDETFIYMNDKPVEIEKLNKINKLIKKYIKIEKKYIHPLVNTKCDKD